MTAPPSQGQPPWGTKQLNGPVPSHMEVGGTHRRATVALTPFEKLLFPEPALSHSLPPPLLGSGSPPTRPPELPQASSPTSYPAAQRRTPTPGPRLPFAQQPLPSQPWAVVHMPLWVHSRGWGRRGQEAGLRGQGKRNKTAVRSGRNASTGSTCHKVRTLEAGSPRNPDCPERTPSRGSGGPGALPRPHPAPPQPGLSGGARER